MSASDDRLADLFHRGLVEPTSAQQLRAKRRVIDEVVGGQPRSVGGRYALLRRLGAGAMGVVYEGHDAELDRRVAIKRVHQGASVAGLERLKREARTLASLSHPNIVTVHDVVSEDQEIYVVMELVEGGSVRRWLGARPRGWEEVSSVFRQAGRGLEAAHAAGIIHRDFKPSNLVIGSNGVVKVIDFGLARATDAPPTPAGSSPSSSLGESWTQGAGTLPYMAPEQRSGATEASSDQYAFCVALFEALSGRLPFAADEPVGIGTAETRSRILRALARTGLPRPLRRALARGLSVAPAERFESMTALLAALERPRRGLGTIGLAVGAGAVALVLATRPAERCELAVAVEAWTPQRLDRARDVIAEPYGPQTADRFREGLERHVQGWHDRAGAWCEAGSTEPTASAGRERLCLQLALDRVASFVETIADGTVAPADPVQRLDRLADPRCDTDPWISLVASSRALADADPRTMALVREISIRSQDGDVAAEARALEELIETHRPEGAGLAWATARLGNMLNAMGAHRRAAAWLEPALVEMERLDAPVLRGVLQAETANALAQWSGREAEALALARRAIAALAEAPDAALHRPGAYGALAVAAWRSHQPAVAVEATTAGLAALADDGWRAHDEALARAQLLNLQALALQDLDRGAEALVALGEAATLVEQTVPNHPDLGRILNNLGDLERSMGQLDLAVAHLERALALKRASGQPDAAMTAMNLGNLRLHTGAFEPALRYYAEAEALLPPDAAVEHRAELLYNRAIAEQGLEHHARAAEGYSMVLALLAPQPAADPEVRYGAHLGRGLAQLRLGEDALARRDLEDALALEPAGVASTDALELRLGLALAQPRAVAARYEELVAEARVIATRASPSLASLASWRAQFEAAGRPWPLAASP